MLKVCDRSPENVAVPVLLIARQQRRIRLIILTIADDEGLATRTGRILLTSFVGRVLRRGRGRCVAPHGPRPCYKPHTSGKSDD